MAYKLKWDQNTQINWGNVIYALNEEDGSLFLKFADETSYKILEYQIENLFWANSNFVKFSELDSFNGVEYHVIHFLSKTGIDVKLMLPSTSLSKPFSLHVSSTRPLNREPK